MKMNYRPVNFRKKIFGGRAAALILAFVLIIALLVVFSLDDYWFGRQLVNLIGYPLWQAREKTFLVWRELKALVVSRQILLDRQLILEDELQLARIQLVNLPVLEQENRDLKNLLRQVANDEVLPAAVLMRPPQTPFDILIVAAGRSQSLHGGEKVFLDNLLLGEVVEVYQKTAKVRLFSSAGLETGAFIERLNLAVRVFGRGGGNFEAKLPVGSGVEVGDVLVVLEEPVRLLGQISAVERNPAEAWERILFRFPVNLSELRRVNILKTDLK